MREKNNFIFGISLVILFIFGFAGCSTFPNSVTGPQISIVSTDSNQKGIYKLGENEIKYREKSNVPSAMILPVETHIKGLKSQIMAFRAAYDQRRSEILNEIDFVNNLQVLGILGAAAGVAKNNLKLQKQGATVAGLSTFYSSHYNLAVQASNYKTAATAMDCVYRKIDVMPDDFISVMYQNGSLQISREQLVALNSEKGSEAFDILSNLFVSINDAIYRLDQKLRDLQSTAVIATAKISDIQSAVDGAMKSQKVSEKVVSGTGGNNLLLLKNNNYSLDLLSKLIDLPASLKLCEATLGG